MKNKKLERNIEDIFRKKMKDVSFEPDDKTWGSILTSLSNEKSRRKKATVYKWTFFITIVTAVFFILTHNDTDKNLLKYSPKANLNKAKVKKSDRPSLVKKKGKKVNKTVMLALSSAEGNQKNFITNNENINKYGNAQNQNERTFFTKKNYTTTIILKKSGLNNILKNNLNDSVFLKWVAKKGDLHGDSAESYQKHTKVVRSKRLIKVSCLLNPYRQAAFVEGDKAISSFRLKNDKKGSGIFTGLQLSIPIARRINIVGGIGINKYSFVSSKFQGDTIGVVKDTILAINSKLEVFNFYKYKTDTLYSTEHLQQKYYYVDFPIGISYKYFGKGKLSSTVNAGIVISKLINSEINTQYNVFEHTTTNNSVEKSAKIRYMLYLGMSFNYTTKYGFGIRASPIVSWTVNSIAKNLPIKERHFFWGTQIGVNYTFKINR